MRLHTVPPMSHTGTAASEHLCWAALRREPVCDSNGWATHYTGASSRRLPPVSAPTVAFPHAPPPPADQSVIARDRRADKSRGLRRPAVAVAPPWHLAFRHLFLRKSFELSDCGGVDLMIPNGGTSHGTGLQAPSPAETAPDAPPAVRPTCWICRLRAEAEKAQPRAIVREWDGNRRATPTACNSPNRAKTLQGDDRVIPQVGVAGSRFPAGPNRKPTERYARGRDRG